jgi:hypothetical protein
VAAREGLQARSFEKAASSFSDAVGGPISADSLARITEGFGEKVAGLRSEEVAAAGLVAQRGESPEAKRLEEVAPIRGQANISTDGAMMLVRNEGWKEVKLTVVSAVEVSPASERIGPERVGEVGPSRRADDPLVKLSEHSYQAGLWDAETLGRYQYAEGLRRGLDQDSKLSTVNDAAVWIGRVTSLNYPEAVQIIDWGHAAERLHDVAKAVFGEGTATSKAWVGSRLDELWEGKVEAVVGTLSALDLARESYPAEVQQAAGYFRNNQDRMHYDEYRALGYPIGSGSAESAANTVVHDRLKRPGRGWTRPNSQAMLAVLSELQSDRFEDAWQATLPMAA